MSDVIIKELAVKGVSEQGNPTVFKYDIGADAKNVFFHDTLTDSQVDLQSQLTLYEKSLGVHNNTVRETNEGIHHIEGAQHIVKGTLNHVEGYRHNIATGRNLHIEGLGHITGKIGFEDLEQKVIVGLIGETGSSTTAELLNESYFFDEEEYNIKITFKSHSTLVENITSIGNITKGILKGVQETTKKSLCIRNSLDTLVFYIKGDYHDAGSFYYLTSFEIQSIYRDIGSPVDGGHVQGVYSNIKYNNYLHVVGNGTANKRSNAHTLDKDGNAEFAGDVVAGGCGGSEPVSLLQIANANKKPLVIYEKEAESYANNYTMGDQVLEAVLAGRQVFVQLIDQNNTNTRALYSPVITYHLPINGNSRLELFYLKNGFNPSDMTSAFGQIPMLLSKTYIDTPLK